MLPESKLYLMIEVLREMFIKKKEREKEKTAATNSTKKAKA